MKDKLKAAFSFVAEMAIYSIIGAIGIVGVRAVGVALLGQ